MPAPKGRLAFLGAGAVGSYTGGMLAGAGHDVVLIDGWPEHVEAIRARGLRIVSPEGEQVVRPEAWHLGETPRLRDRAPEAAFLTVKLYDTAWASALLAQWLPASVPVVTLQNALVEETVARAVGWGRVLGCIGGGMDVALREPGVVHRSRRRHATPAPVFKVGEVHGRITPRAERLAALLADVDRAVATPDLWSVRWEKLCANAMTTGLSGLAGYSLKEVYTREDTRRLAVRLGAEALAVGEALGFSVPKLFGVPPATWIAAGRGDGPAHASCMDALAAQAASMVEGGMSGTLQDLRKGRPTEVDYLNGYVAREGERSGFPAATHLRLAAAIRDVENGLRTIGPDNLQEFLA